MGKWVLIGFGIIALTTGFVVFMAAKNRPSVSPEASRAASSDATVEPVSSERGDQADHGQAPISQPVGTRHDATSQKSNAAAQWKTRDETGYVPESSDQANTSTSVSKTMASPVPGNEKRMSGSNILEQGQLSGGTDLPGTPASSAATPASQAVPTFADPMTEIGVAQPIGLLPGEGEPPYTGPLPGEGEPDYVGPLPGENEPAYTGPLPGENEQPATGPLPGEEGTP